MAKSILHSFRHQRSLWHYQRPHYEYPARAGSHLRASVLAEVGVRYAPGSELAGRPQAPTRRSVPIQGAGDVRSAAAAALATPGLVVITGSPGAGRSTALKAIGEAFRGPVFAGGGLAMLATVPALALARAVRARLPGQDTALLAEAVRSRVRAGLLLLDDLQWADPATIAALPDIAVHCRVAVALRTPHRLPTDAEAALRAAAAGWYVLPPLSAADAEALARQVAPRLSPAEVAAVVRRAGGVPLAVESLARHAAVRPSTVEEDTERDDLTYAVATALADLSRPARTAMAALGLLGRPAAATLLGDGVDELTGAGLVQRDGDVRPVSPYVAEVAAGLLDPDARRALHRRLAGLVPPAEGARHFAAAGDTQAAYARAVVAAAAARTGGERADLLVFACQLPGVDVDPRARRDAAAAAIAAGRPRAAVGVLRADFDPAAAALRGEALVQAGDPAAAAAEVAAIGDDADPALLVTRDRVRLLAGQATVAEVLARHGDPPAHTGLRGAVAARHATDRAPGWEWGLASAAEEAAATGDLLTARWCAWLLVETLAADARLAEAAQTADSAAQACAADLAYSWQTRFLAAQLWCTALRGADLDGVVRRAGDLVDRTLPAQARGYAVAAASLAEADSGLLASARSRLASLTAETSRDLPGAVTSVRDWVAQEAAWLDGQPEHATAAPSPPHAARLVDGLRRITARWAAYDAGDLAAEDPAALDNAPVAVEPLTPVRRTLEAWAAADGDPEVFAEAAAAWHDLAVREEVRCLLAHGLHENEPQAAVPPLLAAERLAEQAGLVVLLGRAHRALRRHSVRRDVRGPRAGGELTDRERDVLRLVAHGEPTRRIAGQLGISTETVETHIRAGMRKLGARTRTEAAAIALEVLA